MKYNNLSKNQSGYMLLIVILVATFLIASLGGLASLGVYKQKLYKSQAAKHQALYVAEAGINYYVWHLAHDYEDYMDGTGTSTSPTPPYGPYQHSLIASSSGESGAFNIEITPPPTGSTIVTIKAIGWLDSYPNIKREITVEYGIPSIAIYSLLTNTNLWIKNGESISGPSHSNGGVRMDGSNDSLVTSARNTYICGTTHGCDDAGSCNAPCTWDGSDCTCPGVWGAGPNSDLWNSPVPLVDFNAITFDIAQLKSKATSSDGLYFGSSGGGNDGYHVIFKNDGSFDVYIVNNIGPNFRQRNDSWSGWINISEDIAAETFDSNYAIPANGVIFFEDDVWVEGVVNGRTTLVAAILPDNPAQRKNINIMGNLTYLARDGNHILGLLAQKDIKVLRLAPDNLTIDGILAAQNGHVFRNKYQNDKIINTAIEIYGGIISYLERSFTWFESGVIIDGYINTNSIYDPQVMYAPPPSFPTTGEYAFISWEEN